MEQLYRKVWEEGGGKQWARYVPVGPKTCEGCEWHDERTAHPRCCECARFGHEDRYQPKGEGE